MRTDHKSIIKKALLAAFLAVLCFAAVSCGGSGAEGGYTLYYTTAKASKLIPYSYEGKSSGRLELAKEFFESMLNVSEEQAVSIIPSGVTIKDLGFSGDILVLDLEGSLEGESAGRLLMFYSGAVRAAAQLEKVSGLQINLNGTSVTDSNGTVMGILRTSRFVNNAVDDPEDYRESEVNMYFGNAAGDRLIKVKVPIAYRSSTAIERAVLEKLIAGPATSGAILPEGTRLTAVIPSGMTVLGINIKDGVCYVNIDDKLIKEPATPHDDAAVYSIVNTLMELESVNSVQITVNGVSEISMPMGQISFTQPFAYNEMLVESELALTGEQ